MARHAFLVLVFGSMLVVPATAAEWGKSFTVTGRPELVLQTDDADIHVVTWDRPEVRLQVTTVGWGIGAGGVHVQAEQAGRRVTCEVREPLVQFYLGRRSVLVEASLPRDADLDVRTGDGSVALSPLSGTVRVRSGDGDIEADGLRGDVSLSTSDGRIRARGLEGALEAHSGDGSLDLEGRFDRLTVGTSDGRVTATALEGSRLDSDWSLRTGDGALTLRVPPELAAELDLHTGDGTLRVALPVEWSGEFNGHALRGRINGGGRLLEMRTGDGPIRLESLAAAGPESPAVHAPLRRGAQLRVGGKVLRRSPARPDTSVVER
jgi:hypothetical protein